MMKLKNELTTVYVSDTVASILALHCYNHLVVVEHYQIKSLNHIEIIKIDSCCKMKSQ